MSQTAIKYPDVNVRLVGEDGNAYAIMGRVTEALKRAGVSKKIQDEYVAEATSGDYNKLLRVTMSWVSTDSSDYDENDENDEDGEDDYDEDDD